MADLLVPVCEGPLALVAHLVLLQVLGVAAEPPAFVAVLLALFEAVDSLAVSLLSILSLVRDRVVIRLALVCPVMREEVYVSSSLSAVSVCGVRAPLPL